jgi:hypothetical protein
MTVEKCSDYRDDMNRIQEKCSVYCILMNHTGMHRTV